MARQRKPFEFGLDVASYNPQGLRHYSEAELKKEYARVGREARERLRKLGQSEFRESKAYQENVGKFKPIKEIQNRRELERLLQEGARFVTAKSSSASGQRDIRRKAIETMHSHGYDWVNTKNYGKFVEFMEQARATGLDRIWYEEARKARSRREKQNAAEKQREMFEQWLAESEDYEDPDFEDVDLDEEVDGEVNTGEPSEDPKKRKNKPRKKTKKKTQKTSKPSRKKYRSRG